MQATEFWDKRFSKGQQGSYSRVEIADRADPVLQRALAHFGSLENKTLIDLGCGRGATSLFFASQGATVISIDSSKVAIANLARYCEEHHIRNVRPMNLAAQALGEVGQADFIFGSMILHHIEPFDQFARLL